jgi:hypothetical protein
MEKKLAQQMNCASCRESNAVIDACQCRVFWLHKTAARYIGKGKQNEQGD